MTPAEIEAAAKARYNAVGDPHFSSDMILGLIYDAEMILATECLVIEDVFQTTSTDGTREYAFPTNAISIRRVEYNGQKLAPAPLEDDPKTNTTAPEGTPGKYAQWESTLILFPTPSTSSHVIKVYCYVQPQALTTSSTALDVPTRYHTAIIDYVLMGMAEKDQNPTMIDRYEKKWNTSVQKIKAQQAKLKRGDQMAVVRDDIEYIGRTV
jgi:hypothetical protein